MGLLWSTASPWSTEAQAAVLSCAVQFWAATEPGSQENESEKFDAAVKTTVEKACCSGRTEVPGAGSIHRWGHWLPQGWEELTKVIKWCHHLLQERGIVFMLENTGEDRCPGTERSLYLGALRCSQQQFRPGLFLRTAFHFWNKFSWKKKLVKFMYCELRSLQVLCSSVNYKTFLFPVGAFSLTMHTKHSLSYPVSSSFTSTSEARGFISDSLSVAYMLSSDFETNGPSHKCPKGKNRCTAVCIAEGSITPIL